MLTATLDSGPPAMSWPTLHLSLPPPGSLYGARCLSPAKLNRSIHNPAPLGSPYGARVLTLGRDSRPARFADHLGEPAGPVGYCWIGRCAERPAGGSRTQLSGPALVYNVCACVQLTACGLHPPAAGSQPRNTLTEPRPGAMAARQPATAGARGGLCAVAGSQPPSRVISQAVRPSARFAARASLRSNGSQAVDRSPSRVGSESAM